MGNYNDMANPILGTAQTPTPNLEQSLNFYKRLGFEVLSSGNIPMVSDGKLVIEINPGRKARAGIKLYNDHWSEVADQLEAYSVVTEEEGIIAATDPNGVYLYLCKTPPPELITTNSESFALTGNFAGISIESLNFDRSLQFWKTVGYNITSGGAEQGWVSMSNGGNLDLSIMTAGACPHLFFNPSFTYFNSGQNLQVIQNVRDAGIPITEEITSFNQEGIVDNIIIRDPGGFGFFLFND